MRKDDDESKWTQLFFAPDDVTPQEAEEDDALDSAAPADHPSLASVDYNEVVFFRNYASLMGSWNLR